MVSFHNIFSIARYEITTLLRSWFFRIFALLAVIILFFFNLGTLVMGNGWNWDLKAVSSIIPYVNLLMLNTVQAVIAIFLASDFLKRDKKLDTTDVIYIRSMSNGEYVAGKTIGNLVVFIILNLIVLSEALIFNLIGEDLTVNWMAYLQYFLIISLPTLIFIMGLSFFVMSILKNQAITFILLLGYVAVTIFYLNTKFYYLFDYMAFSLPLFNSDFIGFGNLYAIVVHRGMYACFGIAFIFLTVSLLKRLPQSPYSNKVILIPAAVFFLFGLYLGKVHVSSFIEKQALRENMRALNDNNRNIPLLKVENYHLDVTHNGQVIDVVARLHVSNPLVNTVNQFVFCLNPGFKLNKVTFNGSEISPGRELQLIEISGQKLDPGESADIEFNYSGSPDEAECFLDIDNKTIEASNSINLNKIDKRLAIVTAGYVLLTRESNWYPVAGTGFGKQSRQWVQKQFSNFELTVKSAPGLLAISQGKVEENNGVFHFTNKHRLSQVSLVIGNYIRKSRNIDKLDFNLYVHKDHDYFTKFFEPIKDTIPTLIAETLKDYERKVDLYYPFERFNLVEVPAQFFSYPRTFIGEREQIQPETVLFPEKGLHVDEADFIGSMKRMDRRERENNSTPEEKKIMALNNFLSLFTQASSRPDFNRRQGEVQVTEKPNPLYFYPLFYNYAYFIRSDQWPVTDRIFETYLKKSTSESGMMGFMRDMQGTSENEKANLALLDHTFAELLDDPEKIQIIDNVIQLKGQSLFSIIRRKTGDDAFDDFMFHFLKSIRFNSTTIEDFNQRVKQQFNIDLLPYMKNWFSSKDLPGYLIGGVKAVSVLDKDRLKTMVKFKITNSEKTEGIVQVQFRLGEGGPGRRRSSGSGMETIERLIYLDGMETKEVSYLLDGTPRNITINTLTSRNIPAELQLPLDNIEEDKKATPFEGEAVSDTPVRLAEKGEFIGDDEDPTFHVTTFDDKSLLQRLLLKDDQSNDKYVGFNTWRAPRSWSSTTNSGFFGKFIRSAHYVKSGDGSKKAIWKIPIKGSGTYEVYTYLTTMRRGGPPRRDNPDSNGEYIYTIYHNEEKENVVMDLKTADNGWNNLGSYYFIGDTVKIELNNKSSAPVVVADAIKLVKQ
jgi:ABC-type transport system involved in multi-copper enzyme maturation permease subunit